MKRFQNVIAITILASGLSACVTTTSPVEVTRFHTAQDQQFAFGSVEVVSASMGAENAWYCICSKQGCVLVPPY